MKRIITLLLALTLALTLCAIPAAAEGAADDAVALYNSGDYSGAFQSASALADSADPTVAMCFAEQRILPMCAAAEGAALDALLQEDALDGQSLVTHLWGHKAALASDPEQRLAYCLRCVSRILSDFPGWAETLTEHPRLSRYVRYLR